MKKILSTVLASFLVLITVLSSVTMPVNAEEKPFAISGALGNDMVLQRKTEVNIWGWSKKIGEKITVSFKGNTVEGIVDENGEWLVKLPEMEADTNENTLTVTMGDYSEELTGILVGDVYIVNGQSNAAKKLKDCGSEYPKNQIENMIAEANGLIRFYQQDKTDATQEDGIYMASPQKDVVPGTSWEKEDYQSARGFSALGFFFAHKIVKETGVPVGMINVSCGGSPVSELMSKEAGEKSGYQKSSKTVPASGIFNALMSPFINTQIKGMLYYQGESENYLAITDYGKYNEYVNIYVEDLREKMNQDFPFYYVQLSSHTVTDWPGIGEQRAVQFDGLSVIKNSAMVVSMDQGFRENDQDWAHPNYKKPVGERLADIALARLYNIGDENYVGSPMPVFAYKTSEGVVVKFKNVGDGLKMIGDHEELSGFRLNKGQKAKVEIIGKDEVLIKTGGIVNQVSYGTELLAFVNYFEGGGDLKYVANLGNSNQVPAVAFKITKIYDSLDEALATPTPESTPQTEKTTEATLQVGGADNPQNVEINIEISDYIVYFVGGGVALLVAIAVVVIIVVKNKSNKKNK